MVTGFGPIDYLVVLLSVVVTLRFLHRSPERLLIWLPLFMTIDFIVPFFSDLSPSRIIPTIIGAWLVLAGRSKTRKPATPFATAAILLLLLAFVVSMVIGDAGLRPIFKAINYFGLVFVYLFVTQMTKSQVDIRRVMMGFALAALVHGSYAIYQIIAHRLNLPFRGIVYDSHSEGFVALLNGWLRVNGVADEPKRLGYVLFIGVLSALYVLKQPITHIQRLFLSNFRIPILLVSTQTFSISYFAAAGVSLLYAGFISGSFRKKILIPILVFLALVSALNLRLLDDLVADTTSIFETRAEELEIGLNGFVVYRQEFFGQDYLLNHPAAAVFGVGLGRYNTVLNNEYGNGAGFDGDGQLMPFNSTVQEIVFDLGLPGLLLGYGSLIYALIISRRRNSMGIELHLILLFIFIQSFSIQLPYYFAIAVALSFQSRRVINTK